MSVSPGQHRLLPAYEVVKHRPSPSHGIHDIRDFFSTCPTSPLENKAALRYKITTHPFPLRADNVKLRWMWAPLCLISETRAKLILNQRSSKQFPGNSKSNNCNARCYISSESNPFYSIWPQWCHRFQAWTPVIVLRLPSLSDRI